MKSNGNRHGFKLNEFVVYPAHGVGQIVAVEEQEVAGFRLELFVINFIKDKMTLRVPIQKVAGVGMRKLSEPHVAQRSLDILTGRARIKRTMWSRRAQEYEAKINSGDINAIAEVVRDLFRSEAQPEQSYSERQLYEAALDRMMREIAAVHKLSETEALKMIETQLKKNPSARPSPSGRRRSRDAGHRRGGLKPAPGPRGRAEDSGGREAFPFEFPIAVAPNDCRPDVCEERRAFGSSRLRPLQFYRAGRRSQLASALWPAPASPR